jgi:hypothetical protein
MTDMHTATRRHRNRWENNIKLDLKEIDYVVWTGLIYFRIGFSGRLL